MLVIDDDDIVKVHIHTNHPGIVIEDACKLGELINIKIDNMKHQHQSIIEETVSEEPETPDVGMICTEPEKDYGFISVCTGKGIVSILHLFNAGS